MYRTQPLIFFVLNALGAQSLTSRFNFFGINQRFVAPDQWQQDVQYWNAITLAGIQQSFISRVVGDVPDDPEESYTYRNEEERVLCSSQVTKTHPCSHADSIAALHKRVRQWVVRLFASFRALAN